MTDHLPVRQLRLCVTAVAPVGLQVTIFASLGEACTDRPDILCISAAARAGY